MFTIDGVTFKSQEICNTINILIKIPKKSIQIHITWEEKNYFKINNYLNTNYFDYKKIELTVFIYI